MTPADNDSEYAYWKTPKDGFTITYSLAVFHEIEFQVSEGFRRIPHGGIETGGLLFGRLDEGSARIEAFRPIESEHASGPSFNLSERDVAGVPALVCGTGYTGEDGVELLIAPVAAAVVWDAVVKAGATPAGLGARDTLRLEACFHLYGNDLVEDRGPIEAGLGWCCKEQTGFIGSERVAEDREQGTAEKLVPFVIDGPGIARQGNPVLGGGVVTSGTFSPCLEQGIGMAYVSAERAQVGTRVELDVRGTIRPATIAQKPLYRKER